MSHLTDLLQHLEPWVWAQVLLVLHMVVQVVLAIRVVMSRRSVGASLAWLTILFTLPILGAGIYLLIGELRMGSQRANLVRRLFEPIRERLHALDRPQLRVNWHALGYEWEQLSRAGQRMMDVPTLPGNRLELFGQWQQVFDRLLADIDSAKINCDFEFYIWHAGGRSDDVVAAIERACQRGVTCRILVDALGSQRFFNSHEAKRLRAAGAMLQSALPGGLWRLLFVRFDLRLHRKIVLIDDQIAWTGSLNLVDPRYFKQHVGVGQWVDAMVRIEGPAVEALAIIFQSDWYVETRSTGRSLPDLTGHQVIEKPGDAAVQVLPSGPTSRVEAIERVLITAVYAAREELIITTPYFVPSEALQMALGSAAQRGVKVIVIIPARVDSILVRLASRAFQGELLEAGVIVAQFTGGLLHTKSVTIDGRSSLFGSLNMDPRSFRLNFEITVAIYDHAFTEALRRLQQSYLDQSEIIDTPVWLRRSPLSRFTENLARLMSPLL